MILRRVRVNDTGGDFSVLVADTETAALTYTERRVVRVGQLRAAGQRHHAGYRLTHGRPQQGIEDCDAEGAIGTRDGRMLSDELALTVSGPVR